MNSLKIKLSTTNCKYKLALNDFVMFEDNVGLKLDTELSFNELVAKDSVLLHVEMLPIEGKNILDEIVFFSCEIVSIDRNNDDNVSVLHKYEFKEQDKKLPKQVYSNLITLKNFTNIPFFDDAEKIDLNKANINSIIEASNKFWGYFNDRNIEGMREFIRYRENNYSIAYELDLNERIDSTLSIYKHYIEDKGLNLFRFSPQDFQPRLSCFGKVISLQDEDRFHPIFFLKKNNEGCVSIPAYFAKIKGEFKLVL